MKDLSHATSSLVVRTDYSDEEAWVNVCREIETPSLIDEFHAYVSLVSDPDFDGLDIGTLASLGRRGGQSSFMFVVDRATLADVEHAVLVLDLSDELHPPFRVIPEQMWSVENNLSLANMDYMEFAEDVDADGVFRGFH